MRTRSWSANWAEVEKELEAEQRANGIERAHAKEIWRLIGDAHTNGRPDIVGGVQALRAQRDALQKRIEGGREAWEMWWTSKDGLISSRVDGYQAHCELVLWNKFYEYKSMTLEEMRRDGADNGYHARRVLVLEADEKEE